MDALTTRQIETIITINKIGKRVFGILALASGVVAVNNLPYVGGWRLVHHRVSEPIQYNVSNYKVIIYGASALVLLLARRRCVVSIDRCEYELHQRNINLIISLCRGSIN